MADQRIQATEEMVGANHATKSDTLNRLTLVEHNNDGTHNSTQTARAWLNFNGTGTPAINADFNVTSITDNGTGDYTINFESALSDANYSVLAGAVTDTTSGAMQVSLVASAYGSAPTLKSTTQCRIQVTNGSSRYDCYNISVAFFR